ncbi:MAG: hypothetical protein A4E38_01124 [Methanoregulaceae archaeon PtaB.Bin108]|jgi:hypothetical protein|nr:MAG: hypothetical protein A4E38_01124 [Methanoregulaceae archaeon PtaB.Bin108]OPY46688.1 MAG: hypothetical protein A4E42_00427 [Methanoregulaceae archaeon PtaU1.Bin222]
MIREVLVIGTLIYILIIAVQWIDRPSLLLQSLLICGALALATALYWFRDEIRISRWEALALWSVILLFVVYGLVKLGGLL